MRPIVLGIAAAFLLHASTARADTERFRFGVISHAAAVKEGESALRSAIGTADADSLAFVVVNGIKETEEACSDKLYERRTALLNEAQNGIVVSLAASDWAYCKNDAGRSAAVARLSRLRELLFVDDFSLGSSRIPVLRQSITPRFRAFAENARWEIGGSMFATVNIPDNNNHYVADAGRNNEFEDRTVANRDWLQRVFTHAKQKKMDGIVFFTDANPLAAARPGRRDGYLEIRRQLTSLAERFPGKVLIVYGDSTRPASRSIRWRDNLGELNAGSGTITVTAGPTPPYYTLSGN